MLSSWGRGKCQNDIFSPNWKVSELESVRMGKCQNWKVSELESVRMEKCQNCSNLESVSDSDTFKLLLLMNEGV